MSPSDTLAREESNQKVADPAATANQEVAAVEDTSPTKMEKQKFFFKKNDLGEKRPTIELELPRVTIHGLVAALQDQKQQDFILQLVNDAIYVAARIQVGDDEKPVNTQEELDISKLSLEFLANQPAAERRGGGIAKEIWEAFGKDYLAVMPALTNKSPEALGNAVKIFLAKFQPVKTNKPVLTFLKGQLALWANNTQNLEEFAECFEFLDNKATTFLSTDDATLLANL